MSKHNTARCQINCNTNCQSIDTIQPAFCPGLCVDHCMTFDGPLLMETQVKCLLTCKYLNNEEDVCRSLCKVSSQYPEIPMRAPAPSSNETVNYPKKDVSNTCSGYGRELCYKICRLHHDEPIETCLCACCKCKF